MKNEKDYIDIIEENLAESFIAIIFLCAFIVGGIIASYFVTTILVKDIIIAISILAGVIALILKIRKS